MEIVRETAKNDFVSVAELKDEGYPVLKTFLNTSVKMKESHREHRPLVDMAPSHKLTTQYLDLHAELEKGLRRRARK